MPELFRQTVVGGLGLSPISLMLNQTPQKRKGSRAFLETSLYLASCLVVQQRRFAVKLNLSGGYDCSSGEMP